MENIAREKNQRQIELTQAEEDLRKLRGQMVSLDVQARQYRQEFNRAEMNLHDVEAKIRNLKTKEFELTQKVNAAKKALLDCISRR